MAIELLIVYMKKMSIVTVHILMKNSRFMRYIQKRKDRKM